MAKAKWPKLPSYLIPLFNTAWVYLCVSKDEWRQAGTVLNVSLADVTHNNGMCRHFVNEDTGENMYLVGVFDGRISTLVHELAHATFYCCSDVGVTTKPDEANETYCYLLDRMFSHFLPFVQETKNAT